MVRVLTSPGLRSALRDLDESGRSWFDLCVWYAMARELRLSLELRDLVASYI